MKIALIKTKLRAKPPSNTTTTNNDKSTEKPKSQKEPVEKKRETHLTISGVCTTVRPEKSGT
jgi:hypothetical protein